MQSMLLSSSTILILPSSTNNILMTSVNSIEEGISDESGSGYPIVTPSLSSASIEMASSSLLQINSYLSESEDISQVILTSQSEQPNTITISSTTTVNNDASTIDMGSSFYFDLNSDLDSPLSYLSSDTDTRLTDTDTQEVYYYTGSSSEQITITASNLFQSSRPTTEAVMSSDNAVVISSTPLQSTVGTLQTEENTNTVYYISYSTTLETASSSNTSNSTISSNSDSGNSTALQNPISAYCSCVCPVNLTTLSISPIDYSAELIIPIQSTNRYRRTKQSSRDYRASATGIGTVACVILTFVFGLFVLSDAMTITQLLIF